MQLVLLAKLGNLKVLDRVFLEKMQKQSQLSESVCHPPSALANVVFVILPLLLPSQYHRKYLPPICCGVLLLFFFF